MEKNDLDLFPKIHPLSYSQYFPNLPELYVYNTQKKRHKGGFTELSISKSIDLNPGDVAMAFSSAFLDSKAGMYLMAHTFSTFRAALLSIVMAKFFE